MLDDFSKRLEPSIVHVGRGQGNVTKRRCDEEVAVSLPAGDQLQTQIEVIGYPIVMETVIGKERAAMAVKAISALQAATGIIFRHE